MPDLLLELFCEEIPAKMQKKAAENLRKQVTDGLVDSGLEYEGAKEYWTPRRLVLDVRGLSARSADIKLERKGPRTDAPQKAIEGFLRGAGLNSVDEAQVRSDPKKGEFYVAVIEKPGSDASEIIADIMPSIIKGFSWSKSMRWGEASREPGSLTWVRPLQSILCMFGAETEDPEIVDFEVSGIRTGNVTFGNRFMAPEKITVKRFEDYCASLKKANVIIDAEQRKEIILSDATNLAFAQGFELVEDPRLLDEVSGLVEWPVVLMGEYDEDFLDIPDEVIQLTIRENQKCFVLKSADSGKLINRFLLVSNIEASDGGKEVARGNGKVVNARLADAKFFWDSDLVQIASEEGFSPWNNKLDAVTFHAKLGTQGERVKRIVSLAQELAPSVGADVAKAKRAAGLCKADLNSAMVYEVPEVQGVIGHIYALRAGEDASVAAAIEEHYKPLGPTDDVPSDPVCVAVALADKLDVLVGFWAIDEKPTGSKDPFALRRAALGVIRLVLENDVRLELAKIVQPLFKSYKDANAISETADLISFFHDRLKVYLRDKGIRHDLIDAVVTPESDDLLAISQRASALQELIASEEGTNLLAGYKRAANILAAEEKKGAEISGDVDLKLLTVEPEKALNNSLDAVEKETALALAKEDYSAAMKAMAKMRGAVDDFFDNVMVNDDDNNSRMNRLALLNRIRNVTGSIADFSKING